MADEPELKPCPFCGGNARPTNRNNLTFWVECQTSYCATTGPERCEADAISAWNRRAPSPLSATTTRNLACIKLHLEIAEVSKRTQALMPSIVNFKDALRRLAEVEAALAEYDATQQKAPTDDR